MLKIIPLLFFSTIQINYCFAQNHTKASVVKIDEFSIKIPPNCQVHESSFRKARMECDDSKHGFLLGIQKGGNFERNVISSNRDKHTTNYKNGILVEMKIGEHHANFFFIKKYDIVIYGGEKNFLLNYSNIVFIELEKHH